jgi:IS5 family transposase
MSQFIPQGQPGLLDDYFETEDATATETPLQRVGRLIDWNIFEPELHCAVLRPAQGPGGRPRFAPLLMFKVLVLQKLHGLADDATSFQIADRRSFRAFLGLTPADLVPDGQTIADFRDALAAAGGFEKLFAVFLAQLQTRGLALAKEGVIVDASFVDVPRQRNTREQNAEIKAGKVPLAFQAKARLHAHKDTDARWAKKGNETHYGYKNHIKADRRDKLILAAVVTAASTHDSQAAAALLAEGDGEAWLDSAYAGAEITADLAAKNIVGHVCEKGVRGRPLTETQKETNREKSKVRARVEHIFGALTGSMKAHWQRSVGLARNTAGIIFGNLVYNLMRYEQIVRLQLVPLV